MNGHLLGKELKVFLLAGLRFCKTRMNTERIQYWNMFKRTIMTDIINAMKKGG